MKLLPKGILLHAHVKKREREREFSPKLPQNDLWRVKVLLIYMYVRQTDPNHFMLTQQT